MIHCVGARSLCCHASPSAEISIPFHRIRMRSVKNCRRQFVLAERILSGIAVATTNDHQPYTIFTMICNYNISICDHHVWVFAIAILTLIYPHTDITFWPHLWAGGHLDTYERVPTGCCISRSRSLEQQSTNATTKMVHPMNDVAYQQCRGRAAPTHS